MAISNIKVTLNCDIKKVWDVVTSLEEYSWRSDIKNLEVLGDNKFIEYTKDGYSTNFTITAFEPMTRYEFDMENSNMKGHWCGIFSGDENQCTIDFTETVEAKKKIMGPFVKGYLKKQQQAYISDLKNVLGDN